MNKFMFAIENFINTAGLGYKAVVNRNQDAIRDRVVLYHTINSNESNYFLRNSNKKTSNRRK